MVILIYHKSRFLRVFVKDKKNFSMKLWEMPGNTQTWNVGLSNIFYFGNFLKKLFVSVKHYSPFSHNTISPPLSSIIRFVKINVRIYFYRTLYVRKFQNFMNLFRRVKFCCETNLFGKFTTTRKFVKRVNTRVIKIVNSSPAATNAWSAGIGIQFYNLTKPPEAEEWSARGNYSFVTKRSTAGWNIVLTYRMTYQVCMRFWLIPNTSNYYPNLIVFFFLF